MLMNFEPPGAAALSPERQRLESLRMQLEGKRGAATALRDTWEFERDAATGIELTLHPDYIDRSLADLAAEKPNEKKGGRGGLDQAQRAARHREQEARYHAQMTKLSAEAAALNGLVINCQRYLDQLEAA